jgi:ABC-2 type transport system permease protein
VVAGAVSIGTAFVVRFTIEWTLAMSALWTNRVSAINQTYEVILVFFSGFFAPLAVMPRPLQILADFLPFRWLIAFPIELTLGRLSPQAAAFGFMMQGFWLLAALTILSFVWRAGVKQYSAVGS